MTSNGKSITPVKTLKRVDPTKARLAENLLQLWIGLHDYSYAGLDEDLPRGKIHQIEARIKLQTQMLLGGGIFTLCRGVKQAARKSLSENLKSSPTSLSKKESIQFLLSAISALSESRLFHLLGSSISGISRLMLKIRENIKVQSHYAVRKALWDAHKKIRHAFWKLLDTWVIRDMPNTPVLSDIGKLSVSNLAEVLESEYRVLCNMAKSKDLPEKYAHQLSQLSGLSIFQCLREQENNRIPAGTTHLVNWLLRNKSRHRRGLFAEFAVALHEFSCTQKKLRIQLTHPEDYSKTSFRKMQAAEEVVEIFMHKILNTGVLENIPV